MQEMIVRHYKPQDRQALREIAWQTAFMGESASIFFEDKEVLCDFLTIYFTDFEPCSTFILESEDRVAGYLTGSIDERVLNRVFIFKIMPGLFLKAIKRGTFLRPKNFMFLCRVLKDCFRGFCRVPDFYVSYPAVLHINIDNSMRRIGAGSLLITSFFSYLKSRSISGVHLATMSEKGMSFFKKIGFSVLYESRRSYFRKILGRDIPVVIFGKKIA